MSAVGTTDWVEVGDRVFVRRYALLDQNIGVVLGEEGALVVDTRATHQHADELLADLRRLTPLPARVVVNTHGHWDHCFGNARFRPAPIWGHVRCAEMMRLTGENQRARISEASAELARLCLFY
jgi:glyoxylase-like metal-dependent hydrolase (beta-lactamase superfamily II)